MKPKTAYNKKQRRVGRGPGSGRGKTSARGHKGQGSRSGVTILPGFEGGQNPIYRRLPKRGFNNACFRREYTILNLRLIAGLGQKEISPETLLAGGVIKKIKFGIKVLGDGELKSAVTVKAHRFSRSAREKIEKSGGKAVVLQHPTS